MSSSQRSYGTTVIPSDIINVSSGGSVDVSAAFERSVAIVGTMNSSEGSATAGEAHRVNAVSDAEELFGRQSELYHQASLALQQNIRVLWCVPVTQTEQTASVSSGSGSIDSGESGDGGDYIIDPVVTPTYSIEAHNTADSSEATAEIVYEDAPSFDTEPDSKTVKINPITEEYAQSGTSTDIDIVYQSGDYETAIDKAVNQQPRRIGLCSESTELANYLASLLASRAQGFQFTHATYGATPDTDPTSVSTTMSDFRMSMVAASRGYVDDAMEEEVRTAGLIASQLASKPLGSSATYDNVGGLTGLRNDYSPNEAGSLIEAGIMPLIRLDGIKIIKDITTSDDDRFNRCYAVEIVDEATEISHIINQQFIGESNTQPNRDMLHEAHRTAFSDMRDGMVPPLLDDYLVNTSQNESNDNQVDIEVGLDIVGVIDTISVNILVGNVITNLGPDEDPVY